MANDKGGCFTASACRFFEDRATIIPSLIARGLEGHRESSVAGATRRGIDQAVEEDTRIVFFVGNVRDATEDAHVFRDVEFAGQIEALVGWDDRRDEHDTGRIPVRLIRIGPELIRGIDPGEGNVETFLLSFDEEQPLYIVMSWQLVRNR